MGNEHYPFNGNICTVNDRLRSSLSHLPRGRELKVEKMLKPMTASKIHLKGKNFSTCNDSFNIAMLRFLLKKKMMVKESDCHCHDEAV